MKLRKQIKNRVVAVVMLAVMILSGFWSFDLINSYATTQSFDFKQSSLSNPNNFKGYKIDGFSGSRVTFYARDLTSIVIGFISTSDWGYIAHELQYTDSREGPVLSRESEYALRHFTFEYNSTKYYVGYYTMTIFNCEDIYSGNIGPLYSMTDTRYDVQSNARSLLSDYIANRIDPNICTMVSDGSSDNVSTDDSNWKGTQNNPQNDEDIGYLVLKTTNTNTQTDLDALKNGIQSVHYNLDWKNKTSTGFSLSKNKYARTFIQFEVESQYVVYSDAKHTKIKHKFDNYGERGWIAKNWDATSKPFSLTTDQLNAALPKSTDEILTQFDQNKIYQAGFTNGNIAINPCAFNFKIRYRVVCTNDIAVIPDSSGGWHAGPWASTVISGDEINDTSSDKSNHEGYGDDKNDNGESDDINHTKTDYDDNQDAKDHINDKPSDNDSELTIDKAISFVKQVTKVPKLIGLALSWLPDWVTAPFFLAFALIPILIIYKCLRG